MPALQDLLEIYGVLDDAAAADPAARAIVDEFLPGASANTGWYGEIQQFFFRSEANTSPNLHEACLRLSDEDQLSGPQKTRVLYGLCVAARIKQLVPGVDLSTDDDEQFEDALANGLAAVGPSGEEAPSITSRLETVRDNMTDFLAAMRLEMTGRNQFYPVRRALATPGARLGGLEGLAAVALVDQQTVSIPLCQAAIRTVNGIRSVVVDTNTSDPTVTLTNLKRVVNPFNWADNYSDFFVSMEQFDPADGSLFPGGGWRRVRETVGIRNIPATYIVTGLRYLASEDTTENAARIDYDLDEPAPALGCDGKVLVDKGYINMWGDGDSPDDAGVRVRTRKIVHIDGLSPYAQKRLVCLTGYGTASNEFLFGPAQNPDAAKRRPFPFNHYPEPDASEQPTPKDPGQGGRPGPGQGGQTKPIPKPDSDLDTHVVATAVGLWADTVQDITSDYFDIAEKWMGGQLTLGDLSSFSQEAAGRIVRTPFDFLDKISTPRYKRGTGSTGKGGGR